MTFTPRDPLYIGPNARWSVYFYPVRLRTWLNTNAAFFPAAAPTSFMPGQYDYPLPPRTPDQVHLPELQGSSPLTLRSLRPVIPLVTRVQAGPGQRLDLTWMSNPPLALLASAAPAAIVIPGQYDYPLPPTLPAVTRGLVPPNVALLSGVVQAPFNQVSWP